VKRRKEQALKNDQKNHKNQKNGPTKKAIKGRITDRKMEEIKAILKKATQRQEHETMLRELGKMEPKEEAKITLEQEKKMEYKKEHNFDEMFEGQHENQHMEMEGLDPAIAQQLERASHKAVLSDAKAQRAILKDSNPKPKTNSNIPDYRDEMDERTPMRRIATNNVTKKRTKKRTK
jgi:hypothetical protein